jgi:ParB family chromosome partitioning protein
MEQHTLFTQLTEAAPQAPASPTKAVNNATLINQTSGGFEYYTPGDIVAAARQVMGRIDLDPASSAIANQTVQATHYYTIDDDGLAQKWYGTVWMNHPFSRANNPKWIEKLRTEYELGDVEQACSICFAATSESWFQPLYDYAMCFLAPRTNYYLPDGTLKPDVTKGSVVTYMGRNVYGFIQAFKSFGRVMLPEWRVAVCTETGWYAGGEP